MVTWLQFAWMPQRERILGWLLLNASGRFGTAGLRYGSDLCRRRRAAAGPAQAGFATADARAIRALTIDATAGRGLRRGHIAFCESEHTSTSQSCRRQDGWNGKRTHDLLSH